MHDDHANGALFAAPHRRVGWLCDTQHLYAAAEHDHGNEKIDMDTKRSNKAIRA